MIIFDDQLRSRCQMRSGLLRKIGMLKVGGIVPAGAQDHRMTAAVHMIHGFP